MRSLIILLSFPLAWITYNRHCAKLFENFIDLSSVENFRVERAFAVTAAVARDSPVATGGLWWA